jgi:hypothetical protein
MYLFNDIVNESLKLIQIAKEKVQPHDLQMYDPNRQSPAAGRTSSHACLCH